MLEGIGVGTYTAPEFPPFKSIGPERDLSILLLLMTLDGFYLF